MSESNDNRIIMSELAFERMQAKEEKRNLLDFIVKLALIIIIVVSNIAWIIACSILLHELNQFDVVDEEYSVELDSGDGGDANYIGNDGDISYGESYSYETQENEAP